MNIIASNDFKDSKVIFSITINVKPVDKNNPDKKYKYKTLWEKISDAGEHNGRTIRNEIRNRCVKSEYSTFIKKQPKYRDFAIGKIDFKADNSGACYTDTKDWRNKNIERQDASGNTLKDKEGNTEYELKKIPLIESTVTLIIKNTDPAKVFKFCQELCRYFEQESVIMVYDGHTYFV